MLFTFMLILATQTGSQNRAYTTEKRFPVDLCADLEHLI